jgi:hypothetical protein
MSLSKHELEEMVLKYWKIVPNDLNMPAQIPDKIRIDDFDGENIRYTKLRRVMDIGDDTNIKSYPYWKHNTLVQIGYGHTTLTEMTRTFKSQEERKQKLKNYGLEGVKYEPIKRTN